MAVYGQAPYSLRGLGGACMQKGVSWVQGEQVGVEVEGLPAADDGDGHQRHHEYNPGCCRASNQWQLLPQLGFVVI